MKSKGFTLIELLIVISLGVLIISLVTPNAVSMYDRLSLRLAKLQYRSLTERTSFESFLRQVPCKLSIIGCKESESVVMIVCRKEVVFKNKMVRLEGEGDMQKIYNSKGFLTATKELTSLP